MRKIATKQAPDAIGPYSQGIVFSNIVITSGQIPIDSKTGDMAKGIEVQTQQCLENIQAILKEEGLTLRDIVKTTVFLKNMEDFPQMNEVYQSFFMEPYPARSTFEVAALPMNALVEIEAIAVMN